MKQSAFYDGLAARQRAIPLVTAVFLLLAAISVSAQQKIDRESKSTRLSVPSAKDEANWTKPVGPDLHFNNAVASGHQSPLVLRPDLIMPKEYKPRETNIPDFLSLDYLKKPSPLKQDDPVVYRNDKGREYLSEKTE
jgi:hypothetical protein